MAFALGEGLAKSVRDALAVGGDGRNLLTYTDAFDNAAWLDNGGSGSVVAGGGPGHKAGTVRGARITDNGGFEVYQVVGSNAEYGSEMVTFSAWVRPVSGCTDVGLEVRNTAQSYVNRVSHPDQTGTSWRFLSVTLAFGAITDQVEVVLSNGAPDVARPDDPVAPAIFEVHMPQLEVGSSATQYVPVTDGSTPLEDALAAVEAEYVDGIVLPAPSQWLTGEIPGLESNAVWPTGYVFAESGSLAGLSITSLGSGYGESLIRLTAGVMIAGEPSNTEASRHKLHRYLRAIIEVLLDQEFRGGFAGYTMGAAPIDFDYGTPIVSNNQMFSDGRLQMTFAHAETR